MRPSTACVRAARRIVSVAVGSVVGQVALRPTSPLTAAVIATIIIVVGALLVDMAYVNGLIPNSVVQVQPVLLYTEGKHGCAAHRAWQAQQACTGQAAVRTQPLHA